MLHKIFKKKPGNMNPPEKKIFKTKLATACANLLVLYPEYKDEIAEQAAIIKKCPLKTAELQTLQSDFINWKDTLLQAHVNLENRKNEIKENEQIQVQLEKDNQLRLFRKRLADRSAAPSDVLEWKLRKIFWELDRDLTADDVEGVFHAKEELLLFKNPIVNFFKLYKQYINEITQISRDIASIIVISEQEEKQIQEKIKENNKKLSVLAAYEETYNRKKKIFDELNHTEHDLVYFSPLSDPKSMNEDQLVILKDGSYGRSTDKSETHPFLKPNDVIRQLYNDVKQSRIQILNLLSADDMEKKKEAKESLVELMLAHEKKIKAFLPHYGTHHEYLKEKQKIVKNLKIDKNNREDLQFWHSQTSQGWHGKGGSEVTLDKEQFRIPSHIYKMMEIVNTDHADTESFVALLDKARMSSKSVKPLTSFSWFTADYRGLATADVYEAKDLATYKVATSTHT